MQTPVLMRDRIEGWRLINWIGALALALVLACAHLLDGISDHSGEQAQADALNDAIKTEQARLRLAKRIAARCGVNAVASELGGGLVQCADKHGRKTIIAQVAP